MRPGVSEWDVQRIHVLVEKASKQLVRGPVSTQTDSMSMGNGRHVVILTVPNGPDKPYFDVDGVIWVTEGAGKRRVDSKKDFVDLFQGALRLRTDDCQPTVQRRKSGAESDPGSTSSKTSGKRTVRRSESSAPATRKTSGKIIELVKENANVTIPELSGIIGVSTDPWSAICVNSRTRENCVESVRRAEATGKSKSEKWISEQS